jgi:hypothetical protein
MNTTIPKEDLEFLANLDKKLHYVTQSTYSPNMGGRPFPIGIDQYHKDVKLTKEELSTLDRIVKEHDITLEPVNTCMGFQVGFMTYREEDPIAPGIEPETTHYNVFLELQLPEGENFETMKKRFDKKQNWKPRYSYDY